MGVHFLCLNYYIEIFKKIRFNINDINNKYHNFVKLEYIRSNCYILLPCSILQSFVINTNMLWENHIYRCISNRFEISKIEIKDLNLKRGKKRIL
ncbi:DUF261 family protein (plasmid) [Borrelia parkeri]|uniref:DUF261 family protein n=1 Tax=Borrelia parkeri TaxID=141 RepID=UPI003D7C1989|nr:DUF261 family protein [Borrelia parkeri]